MVYGDRHFSKYGADRIGRLSAVEKIFDYEKAAYVFYQLYHVFQRRDDTIIYHSK